jgi:predicted unusual protein kinase regulating ubiquinone biosynthesis (AarF/ABC1/UbiB family)
MGLSLKTEHLKRYSDVARLFVKYGRSDLVKSVGLDEALEGETAEPLPEVRELALELARDLEELGPTYVKLGQLLSTRPDLLPLPFIEALARLQDDVEPFPFSEVEGVVTAELGVRMNKAFLGFDEEPVAAASLGQVHRAVLRSGREVAVKVQRPGIRERIIADLEALGELAGMLDRHTETGQRYELSQFLEEFRKALMRELDYRAEARNLATLRENLAGFERIVVPQAVDDYTTSRLLTTDYVRGHKVTTLNPVARLDMDGSGLADQLFEAYLKQILLDGFVHADPHPGNIFVTYDDRLALFDLGMVARVAPPLQEKLLQLLIAVSEGRSDEAATVALAIGVPKEGFDEIGFRRKVAELVAQAQGASIEQIQVGRSILLVSRMAGECGVRVPPELALLGKTLLNLDQVGRALDPGFDPNAAIRRHAADLTQQRMRRSFSMGSLLGTAVEMKDFLQRFPARVNRLLDTVADNRLKVQVDAIDEKLLVEGINKVANRITMGLVLAAMIVGAAMLMRVETSFRILGYPGLAMLLFLVAAGSGLALVVNIFVTDHRAEREARSLRKESGSA